MTKKLDKARFYRNGYKAMRKEIIKDLTRVLEETRGGKIKLQDERGDLIYQSIDDQENEMIMSIELVTYPPDTKPPCLVVWTGVWEEDNTVGIEDLGTELLLNVMDAIERAVNNPE